MEGAWIAAGKNEGFRRLNSFWEKSAFCCQLKKNLTDGKI
jgi:hypothetical protein